MGFHPAIRFHGVGVRRLLNGFHKYVMLVKVDFSSFCSGCLASFSLMLDFRILVVRVWGLQG